MQAFLLSKAFTPRFAITTGAWNHSFAALSELEARSIMTRKPADGLPYHARPGHRLFTAVIGLLLIGVGLYALLGSTAELALRVAAGLGFLLLGVNMLVSARRGTESWLSRLGPLP